MKLVHINLAWIPFSPLEGKVNEGMTANARRITAIVLSKLSMLASFAFLPWEVALATSLTTTALLLAWGFSCCEGNPRMPRPHANVVPIVEPVILEPVVPFYQRVFHWIPLVGPRFFGPRPVAVVNPGLRVPVGRREEPRVPFGGHKVLPPFINEGRPAGRGRGVNFQGEDLGNPLVGQDRIGVGRGHQQPLHHGGRGQMPFQGPLPVQAVGLGGGAMVPPPVEVRVPVGHGHEQAAHGGRGQPIPMHQDPGAHLVNLGGAGRGNPPLDQGRVPVGDPRRQQH